MGFKREPITHESLAGQEEEIMARNLLRNRKGATMVELAIVIPLLLMVLFAIVEFSIALYDKAVLTNASREGARAGIVSQSPRVGDAAIKKVVKDYASTFLISNPKKLLGDGDITIEPGEPRTGSFGTNLTVTVNYAYNFLVFSNLINYFFGGTFGSSISLTAKTVMKLE
jgi:Flp pilus assembly protein TadG